MSAASKMTVVEMSIVEHNFISPNIRCQWLHIARKASNVTCALEQTASALQLMTKVNVFKWILFRIGPHLRLSFLASKTIHIPPLRVRLFFYMVTIHCYLLTEKIISHSFCNYDFDHFVVYNVTISSLQE